MGRRQPDAADPQQPFQSVVGLGMQQVDQCVSPDAARHAPAGGDLVVGSTDRFLRGLTVHGALLSGGPAAVDQDGVAGDE